MPKMVTAEQMVLAAVAILQRGLPPGDLNDRQVITELWGIFDNAGANEVIRKARAVSSPSRSEPANDTD